MLPKIEHPVHEVFLKSLGKNVRFRPFLVKEEKLLLRTGGVINSIEIINPIIFLESFYEKLKEIIE